MIDRLPQQRDFLGARVDELSNFVDDVSRRAMHLRAARVGNDAVSAEFVTPARDAHVGLGQIVVRGDRTREIE